MKIKKSSFFFLFLIGLFFNPVLVMATGKWQSCSDDNVVRVIDTENNAYLYKCNTNNSNFNLNLNKNYTLEVKPKNVTNSGDTIPIPPSNS